MTENTKIEWADHTFNPWIGCTEVSPACDHCYARELAKRYNMVEWGSGKPRKRTSEANWKLPLKWNRQAQIRFDAWERFKSTNPGVTDDQLLWHGFIKPHRPRVFCASLADVFDNGVDPQWRADLFALIEKTPNLDWLLLTKRIGNVRDMVPEATDLIDYGEGWQSMWGQNVWPENVWLGATVANQEEANRDIPKLLEVPAAVRFLSMEPLLGPVNLTSIYLMGNVLELDALRGCEYHYDDNSKCTYPDKIDWVIVGGESGQGARPMHPDWVSSLRDQCAAANVPFFFKQWGDYSPVDRKSEPAKLPRSGYIHPTMRYGDLPHPETGIGCYSDEKLEEFGCAFVAKIGKKAAGRLLDGVQHDGFPTTKM